MKEFITDSIIIENIFNLVLGEVGVENKGANYILTLLPKIIVFMESEYKLLLGLTKKQLVINIIIKLMEHFNCTQTEIDNMKVILPDLIDSLVFSFNKTSKLFRKKIKKCCIPVNKRK